MGRLFALIASLVLSAAIFGLAFALGAVGLDWLSWEFAPEPMSGAPPRALERVLSFFYLLVAGGVAGALAGLVHALIPKAARDVWMGMALGAAAALALLLVLPYAFVWELAAFVLAGFVGAICAWLVSKIQALPLRYPDK